MRTKNPGGYSVVMWLAWRHRPTSPVAASGLCHPEVPLQHGALGGAKFEQAEMLSKLGFLSPMEDCLKPGFGRPFL